MKAYVVTTAVVFGLLTLVHVWRFALEGPDLAGDPWFVAFTVVSAAICLWACRLLWRGRRA